MEKGAIFDLDGTLLYTLEDLKDSVNFALEKYDYPPRTLDEIRNFVGNGVKLLIKRSIPQGTLNPNFEECLDCFKKHYDCLKNPHIFYQFLRYDLLSRFLKILLYQNTQNKI